MKAKLVVESLEELFEEKESKAKSADVKKEHAKTEQTKSVKVTNDVQEKIAALKKVEAELEAKLQKEPGPIAKKSVQDKLNTIKDKIATWNKKL